MTFLTLCDRYGRPIEAPNMQTLLRRNAMAQELQERVDKDREILSEGPWYDKPDWDNAERIHDWRNYADEELRQIWSTFTLEQKRIIAELLEKQADREEWD